MMNVPAEVTGTTPNTAASMYLAILKTIDGTDYLFLSTQKDLNMSSSESSATNVTLGNQATGSKAAALDANAGYVGSAWCTAVPEPTSGLLLLVGLGALALRRRRA